MVYSDGSFRRNNNGSSLGGFTISLSDNHKIAPAIDYSRIKSQRIVRSVLGADIFGLADTSDAAITFQHDTNQIIQKCLKINTFIDSETLFNIFIRNESTTERKLVIDVKAAREVYNNGIIVHVVRTRRM